jgi:DNA-binding MltR family transcriptional regulator
LLTFARFRFGADFSLPMGLCGLWGVASMRFSASSARATVSCSLYLSSEGLGMPEIPTPEEITKILHMMSRRADTSYIIVSGTALEDLLEQAILGRMRDLSGIVYDRIFASRGPLNTFSAKIDLAFAFEIIDEGTTADFHALREIRNAFAHAKTELHFESKELRPLFQKFTRWTKSVDSMKLFDESVAALTITLNRYLENSIFVAAFQKSSQLKPSRDK